MKLTLIAFALIVFIVFIIKSTNDSAVELLNYSGIYMRMLINHVHLILFISSFNFNWSQYIHKLFNAIKPMAQATTMVFSLDCFFNDKVYGFVSENEIFRLFF